MPEGEFLIATTDSDDLMGGSSTWTRAVTIYKAGSRKEAKKFVKRWNEFQRHLSRELGGYPGDAVLIDDGDPESAAEWLRWEKQFRKENHG